MDQILSIAPKQAFSTKYEKNLTLRPGKQLGYSSEKFSKRGKCIRIVALVMDDKKFHKNQRIVYVVLKFP